MDYPRVTEVLKPFSNLQYIPQHTLDRAAIRGTTVHSICAALAKGAFVPDGMIADELMGYIQSFKKWTELQVESFLVIEKRYIFDGNLPYTGQVDYVLLAKDQKMYLADIKTSAKPHKTYPLQMAAYEWLLRDNKIFVEGVMIVYLNKNGDFPDIHLIEKEECNENRAVFFGALQCWYYFNGDKKDGREIDRTEEREES